MIKKNILEICNMIDGELLTPSYSNTEISGVSIDSRTSKKNNIFIPIVGENVNGHRYIDNAIDNGCIATLWNKNEPNPPTTVACILVEDTVKALQQLAISYRNILTATFIGITGSNGKTSTKDILASILATKYKTQKTLGNHNNELGVPLTILELDEDCEMAVIEMGIEKPGDLLFLKPMVKPHIGILTNVGPIHIENFNSINDIVREKLCMIDCLDTNGLFIYNGGSSLIKSELSSKTISKDIKLKKFGENSNNHIYSKVLSSTENGISFSTYGILNSNFETTLLGKHQALNCISCILVALEFGLTENEIQNGLLNINATGLRNEIIKLGKTTILNDSYKSNPQSLLAALDILKSFSYPQKIAVLGDMVGLGENYEKLHYDIGLSLVDYNVDELITFGNLGKIIGEGAKEKIKKISNFMDKTQLAEYLLPYLQQECAILFKASRAIKLEEVIAILKKTYNNKI